MTRVVGILLAAGSSRRFGAHKLLARLPDDQPVALRCARTLLSALPHSIAVTRPHDPLLCRQLAAAGMRLVANPKADSGMGSSIAAAITASIESGPPTHGWVIALADMPWLRPATIAAVTALIAAGASAATPVCDGRRGHPVGFAVSWRHQLLALSGDRGARALLEAAGDAVVEIPTSDSGTLRDIDRPSDLATIKTAPERRT